MCFQICNKEKTGLEEQADVVKSVITSSFEEATSFLDADGMSKLKEHYLVCYWQTRKDFLDFLEDFMTQDSITGSTISTRPKKAVSCASKISSPGVVSEDKGI
jgi:hypothetical protein